MPTQTLQQQASVIGRVFVCDPSHPHFGETGVMPGTVISLFGKKLAEVRFENCKHGTDGCFVSVGQVKPEARRRR